MRLNGLRLRRDLAQCERRRKDLNEDRVHRTRTFDESCEVRIALGCNERQAGEPKQFDVQTLDRRRPTVPLYFGANSHTQVLEGELSPDHPTCTCGVVCKVGTN
jgi:hypothetical protein